MFCLSTSLRPTARLAAAWYARAVACAVAAGLFASAVPVTTYAAEQNASFGLHPHCRKTGSEEKDWVFGPIPSPGIVADTRGEGLRCSQFEVRDPQTMQTDPLRVGDILDIDLVVKNPDELNIQRVRAWLIYDPNLLKGEMLEISTDFPEVTPDEKDFSEAEGYVKIEAAADNRGPNDDVIIFARLQFRVLKTNPIGTPITFHDVQPSGHSVIIADEGQDGAYVVGSEPGTLLVRFAEGEAENNDETEQEVPEPEQDDIGNIFDSVEEEEVAPEPTPDPEPEVEPAPEPEPEPEDDGSCVRDADCKEGICIGGQCTEKPTQKPNGGRCSRDTECESGLCGSGICVPSLRDEPEPTRTTRTPTSTNRTAFSLLQIRNLRVTTDGSTVFLAWDPLKSSQLKAYNIYYGRTSGKYIQRRTIDKTENSITLRSLPLEKEYFFAVRGLSTADEESAFSQEVSIVVGDPDSSSAPLVPGSISDSPGINPVGSISEQDEVIAVPGETGVPSMLMLFLVSAAVIGTYFAFRRQLSVTLHE